MSRIQARDSVFKLVFEYQFLKDFNQNTLNDFLVSSEVDDLDKQYIEESYNGILQNYDTIIEIIKNNLERYTMDKITKLDLSILTVAVYEICFKNEVTEKVAINEAVELAKKYSSDNSYKFINGVLARVVVAKNNNG